MTPALVIIVASVAIVWRVVGCWCRRDVDVEAMGFVEMERPKRNTIAEAQATLDFAADLMAFGIGYSEWNSKFQNKVDSAERFLSHFTTGDKHGHQREE